MSRPQWPDSHQRLSDKPGAIHTCTATLDRVTIRFGHSRLSTLLGTHGAFRSVQKTEGKRDKATVLLTVAFSNESTPRQMQKAKIRSPACMKAPDDLIADLEQAVGWEQ